MYNGFVMAGWKCFFRFLKKQRLDLRIWFRNLHANCLFWRGSLCLSAFRDGQNDYQLSSRVLFFSLKLLFISPLISLGWINQLIKDISIINNLSVLVYAKVYVILQRDLFFLNTIGCDLRKMQLLFVANRVTTYILSRLLFLRN